jgi:hypothetical protein
MKSAGKKVPKQTVDAAARKLVAGGQGLEIAAAQRKALEIAGTTGQSQGIAELLTAVAEVLGTNTKENQIGENATVGKGTKSEPTVLPGGSEGTRTGKGDDAANTNRVPEAPAAEEAKSAPMGGENGEGQVAILSKQEASKRARKQVSVPQLSLIGQLMGEPPAPTPTPTPEEKARAKAKGKKDNTDQLPPAEAEKDRQRIAEHLAKIDKESPEQTWDRIRDERPAGKGYFPSWKDFQEEVKAARTDAATKEAANRLEALANEFETLRRDPAFAYDNLKSAIANAKQADYQKKVKTIQVEQSRAAQAQADYAANKEAFLTLVGHLDFGRGLTAEQRQEMARLYKVIRKRNATAAPTIEEMVAFARRPSFDLRQGGATIPEVQAALTKASGTKDLASILDVIVKAPGRKGLKYLAEAIRNMVGGIGVVYQSVRPTVADGAAVNSTVKGRFTPSLNQITIFPGGENAQVVLHETVHALTVSELRKAEDEARAGGKPKSQEAARRATALRNLNTLLGYLEANPQLKGQYALKSNAEFIAEVWSNPELQASLKGMKLPDGMLERMPAKGMSVFESVVATVRQFLGLKEGTTDALTMAIDVTGEFFLPNSEITAGRITRDAQSRAAGAAPNYDSILTSPSPDAAMASTATGVQDVVKGGAEWVKTALGKTDAKPKLRQLALYLSSTKNMESWVENSTHLKSLHSAFKQFFTADELKTRSIGKLKEFLYAGQLQQVQNELFKVGKGYAEANSAMGFLASEQSLLAEEAGFTIDPTKDYAGNKAAHPTLDPSLRERIDNLNAAHNSFSTKHPGLAKLINDGFMATRKAHIMFSASRFLATMQAHQYSPESSSYAAKQLAEKYGTMLDILADAKGARNSNPALFLDAKTSELDENLRKAFADADKAFAGESMQESIRALSKAYERSVATPYQFSNRPGQYFASFNVADKTAAGMKTLNDALEPFGKKIGGFPGESKSVYIKFESQMELEAALRALKGVGPVIESDISSGKTSDAGRMATAFGAASAINKVREAMIARYDELRATGSMTKDARDAREQAIAMLNNSFIDLIEADSARTTLTKRKGTPGADMDYLRTFAKRGEFYISLVSNQYAQPHFDKAFRDMGGEIDKLEAENNTEQAIRGREVMDELLTRTSNAMNPVDAPIIRAMTAFGYHFYLSLSPAFALVNLLQPWQLTLPLIGGRYGFVKTTMAMMRASQMAYKIVSSSIGKAWAEGGFFAAAEAELDLKKAGLNPGQVAFMKHMIESGVISNSQVHEIGRMAEGDDRRVANAAKAMGVLTHYSEVMNRVSAGLAAYNMASEAGSMSEAKKIEYATSVVNQTQFLYSDHNTARAIGRHGIAGKLTPMLASFQNYALQMMEHYIRLLDQGWLNKSDTLSAEDRAAAKKAMFGTLAMTGAIAGTMGLPFANVLAVAMNAFADDDDKKDIRSDYREFLANVFGKDVAEVVAHGATRAAGFDISASAGHQDLLPGTRFLADRRAFQDKIKDGSLTMMGPAINGALDIVGGLTQIMDGNLKQGFETALPRALKGVYKAQDMARTGSYEDKAGNALPIPISPWDIGVQAAGFTPSKKSDRAEANFYYQAEQSLTKQAKARMLNTATKAYERGDMEEFDQAVAEIEQYNLRNPEQAITGLSERLASRARGRAFAAMQPSAIIERSAKHLPGISAYNVWANTGVAQ